MSTKKCLCMLLCAVMMSAFVACGENEIDTSDDHTVSSTTDSNVTDTNSEATDEVTTPTPPKSLKILAIGNSFSTDCMEYLYEIAKAGGVEEIILGNLYYGGCSLEQHLGFAKADSASYTYYKNTSGKWESTKNYKMSDALVEEDWDFITLQQTSKTCGLKSSYGTVLTQLVDYVCSKNDTATLVWNATWAYQQDSTHSSFPKYDNDQGKMYDMIIECVEECILPEERIKIVIPCMTSIQNARTSFIGDTLTRDGYHLNYNIGRYIAGLTWYATLTEMPIETIVYNPSVTQITADMMRAAKEAVNAAVKNPLKITKSSISEGEMPKDEEPIDPSVILDPADFLEVDTAIAAANSVDLSKYTLLDWDYLENTYWNCTSKAGTTTPKETAGTYKQNVCTAKKYSLTELPVGTIFILDNGWQYRLEIYTDANSKYEGTRPSMSQAQFYVLTQEFMGNCQYIAWNISSSPKSDISQIYAQAACHLRVYIPNK